MEWFRCLGRTGDDDDADRMAVRVAAAVSRAEAATETLIAETARANAQTDSYRAMLRPTWEGVLGVPGHEGEAGERAP